jgi:superfamily II DNA or RNA helicase
MTGTAAGQTIDLPGEGSILTGPFWSGPVQVVNISANGSMIQVQAVELGQGRRFSNLSLTIDQFLQHVRRTTGTLHDFKADARLFRLASEATRMRLAHAFDPQFAVSVSQVDPLPHQLDAVYRHMLPQTRIRFLLADDPGAGKTIMAGLLARELMQLYDIRRILVLCPKALTDQWRREMWERFRLKYTVLTGDSIRDGFGQNAWVEHDLVIASIDLAIQDHILPGIEQSAWDLVVFDEAHKLSAYRYGAAGKIDKTRRYQLAEKLAKQTDHLLLMTATPHKGDDENFRLLLQLLDETVFASQAGTRQAVHGDHSPYFLRRMKESMRDFNGRPIFHKRTVETVRYRLENHEEALYDAVTEYVASGLEQAESNQNRNVSLALTVLQRRLASSLYAITRSLERRRDRLTGEAEEARSSGRAFRTANQPAIGYDPEDDELDDLTTDEEDALSAASNARSLDELLAEIRLLDELLVKARTATASGLEKKLVEFRSVIESGVVLGGQEKVLVFTEHRDTLHYLERKLREWGYGTCVIHGGMKLVDRIAAEKEFRGPTQFMIATDAAGEGINLQFCRIMFNWDLPWNPNRLEQRMGRIHRYGQQFEVQVYNLVAENTREGAVLERLMDKLERMQATMGTDQIYDVISSVLDGAHVRLDVMIREAILNRRPLDEILAALDTVEGDSGEAAAKEALGAALATKFIDMSFIDGERRESKERRLTPEYVEGYFVQALRHLGGRLAAGQRQDWRVEHVPVEIRRAVVAANAGERGQEQRLITFRKERAGQDPPAEFVGPGHPLFEAVTDLILKEGGPALNQGAVLIDPQAPDPYLLWLLEAAVVNGLGAVTHQRLLALRQFAGHVYEPVSPGAVLDLLPERQPPSPPAHLVSEADSDAAVQAASSFYAAQYLDEVSVEQERQAEVIERALNQSINDRMSAVQAQLERQIAEQERGRDMTLAIRQTNEEIERLTLELDQRRRELRQRRVNAIQTPRVVGVAAVLPAIVPHAWQTGGDQTKIEQAAMAAAIVHELAAGRRPEDVSKTGVGYDIRSAGPDGETRYIEVKGHLTTGDVVLYYTEWVAANRLGEEFFIYLVDQALGEPVLWVVQDPVAKGIRPVEKVIEFRIPRAQLQAVAE